MCGIAGVISTTPIGEEDGRCVHEMVGRLVHRGPDSSGFFTDPHVVLGMRRLSIIDLAGGRQPIYNETGDLVIICNGEIYNHAELRQNLKARGHRFQSDSDVETIIHLYEDHGPGCLEYLRGMFAFALWDGRKKKLLLARDRMGEKPLYLHRDDGGRLWFSSELRSIMAAMSTSSVALSPEGVNLFLTFQYVPEPATLLDGLTILPAGHLLSLSPDSINMDSKPYWEFLAPYENGGSPVERVREALSEACRLMGSADVPVGVALSGGIDSSLVATFTDRHFPGQVHAFSVGYPGRPSVDERPIAERLAGKLGTPFTEVEVSTEEVVRSFPELVHGMDTPIADIAAHGYYAVSRAAREAGVPVLLSGLGGDELFWGYDWVRQAVKRNTQGNGSGRSSSWWRKLLGKKEIGQGRPTFFEVHDELRLGDKWSRQALTKQARDRVEDGLWIDLHPIDQAAPMDMALSDLLIRTWLRCNCLALCDRVSMAHSVEMRLPLLDRDLINLVRGLRFAGLGDWQRPHKWLLIEAIGGDLPGEILYRKKQGFTPPVEEWLTKIANTYHPLLNDSALVRQNIFDQSGLAAILPKVSLNFRYKLVLLEVWTRLVVEGARIDEIARLAGGKKL